MKHVTTISTKTRTKNEAQLLSQALRTLRGIPNLTVKETVSGSKPFEHGIDLSVELRSGQKKFRVAIEAKSTGEPAVLRRSVAWLKNQLARTKHQYGVIVAPYISGEGATICRDMGIGFIDLSGNCLLNLDGLYIERTGSRNKFRKPREIQSLFSPKSSRVIRCLLSEPKRAWTLKGLSKETGVSIGLIHRLAVALEDNFFAEKKPEGVHLEDPARLLEVWREEYQRRPRKWARYVVRIGSVDESVNKLKTAAIQYRVRYALSGPSGASFISAYLNPNLVHVYVDILKNEFLEKLSAYPVTSEGNFLVRVAEQENEFIGAREVNGLCIVSDLQLYLDLWSMGGRGQEAAEDLRRRRLNF